MPSLNILKKDKMKLNLRETGSKLCLLCLDEIQSWHTRWSQVLQNRHVIFVLCSVHGILSVIIFGCTSWNGVSISIIWCWMFVCTCRWISLHLSQMNLLHSTHLHLIFISVLQSSQSFEFISSFQKLPPVKVNKLFHCIKGYYRHDLIFIQWINFERSIHYKLTV
jgi:hypothetical protein